MRYTKRVLSAAVLCATSLSWGTPAVAGPEACVSRVNNTHAKLQECVTLGGVREHQAALQAIADTHGGVRAAGTSGYDASLAYVVDKMTSAGYRVSLNAFPFTYVALPTINQVAPIAAAYEAGAFTGTGYGDVAAAVTPVDINLVPGRANTSGCEAADFAGFPAGNIALIQRGTCTFQLKAENAQAAGAVAVIIFNQGNTPARSGVLEGTLVPAPPAPPPTISIPVAGLSFADGAVLTAPGSVARVTVAPPTQTTQYNVIAESTSGDPDNVVMAGAHLDSVRRGPGINDNGSGSAALLELGEAMAKVKPVNKVRLAWWGAEESGLIGSNNYVAGLSAADRQKIALYLNFDMVGSPNHVFFVYDGDDSDLTGAPAGPAGSAQIEETFEAFYNSRGIPFKGTDFSGRSDYGAFIAHGIPAGGLFTGAEGIKSADEAALWGGTAGQQYDPCYHLACDTYANNNDGALDVNSDAIAFSVLQYAMSTNDVNGSQGKGNFPPVGGGGGQPGGFQGGLHDDHDLPVE